MRNNIETLLSINPFQSIRKAVFAGTTFNSAGRSGEASHMCYDDGCYWEYDHEVLYTSKKKRKWEMEKITTLYRLQLQESDVMWTSLRRGSAQ
jgi:hypothetical protein